MKVKMKFKEDEVFVGASENGHEVHVDMRPLDMKQGQSPTELLLSALASCAAVEIVSMIKKRRKTLIDLQAEIEGDRREEHPRGFTRIHLKYFIFSPDVTPEEASRIVELAATKYCSVAASLKATQTHSFEIIRPS